MRGLLGDVSERTSIVDLRQQLSRHGDHSQRRLVQILQEVWQEPRALDTESSRVLLARLTAAALPLSASVVRSILKTPIREEADAELQFSLFVAFSDLPELVPASDLAFVREQVEQFLEGVQTNTAQAAWMGGDLLGDHWPLTEGVPVLSRLARFAEHSVGREAAIHGLSHALGRATKAEQWQIVGVLKEVAAKDPTPSVRNYAESVMGELRGI